MTSLEALADALAAVCATAAGVERAYAFAPDAVAPPCVVVRFPELVEYGLSFGGVAGTTAWTFPVLGLAARADARNGQRALARFFDAQAAALVGVLEMDPSLGGVCDGLEVGRAERFGEYDVNGVAYVGMLLVCRVITSGPLG